MPMKLDSISNSLHRKEVHIHRKADQTSEISSLFNFWRSVPGEQRSDSPLLHITESTVSRMIPPKESTTVDRKGQNIY